MGEHMATSGATDGATGGAAEAGKEGAPPPWWLNLWVQRLRERGSLNQMPPVGERCFYGNPWRGLAEESDLVLERTGLQAGEPSLWEVLSQPYSDAGENALSLFERLRPQAFLWACLCEWLVNDVMVPPNENSPYWPIRRCHFIQKPNMAKYFRRSVLFAYVELFERLASTFRLDPASLECFLPEQVPVTNMRWTGAPPFAGLLLFKYLVGKGEQDANRGARVARRMWNATRSDQLVETPGGIKDFPERQKLRLNDRFPFAMAVDKYLFEHQHLAARAAEGGPVTPHINTPTKREPRPSADQAAHDMGIPWLNPAGQSSSGLGEAGRFVPPSAAMQESIAAKARLESDEDTEPWIDLRIDLPQDFPADVYEMMAVIYTEARVDGQAVSDAVYGFVDTVEGVERGDQVTFRLCIRPIFASGSWLYQAGQSARGADVTARLMPASWSTQGQLALGIHVVLGRLQPVNQPPNSPQQGG